MDYPVKHNFLPSVEPTWQHSFVAYAVIYMFMYMLTIHHEMGLYDDVTLPPVLPPPPPPPHQATLQICLNHILCSIVYVSSMTYVPMYPLPPQVYNISGKYDINSYIMSCIMRDWTIDI